ncbi:Dephospho-CoA kinase cab5 [Coemansia guatemalensis]|uniref:Dephospho-CoA kinase cab5 n=1 Tax=Coemansia guatemalensis TaxID=2761395 RepID=A0A9W8HU18_9FUNG|nr:Dephospho-CoA kinase cab5 [Coemansia guatemalensis]
MLVIGLTGGIATGKSTASKAFRAQGVPVIDADAIAHELMEPGQVSYRLVVEHFGTQVLSEDKQTIDRAQLGRLIFNDAKQRQALNSFTHPYIRRRILWRVFQCYVRGHAVCVVDVPLLFEAGLDRMCARTLVVACTDQQQIARLMERNGLSRPEADARVAAQMPMSEKMRRATRVLDNSASVAELNEQVHAVLRDWTPSVLRTFGALLAPVGLVVSLPLMPKSMLGFGTLCAACATWIAATMAGL